MNRQLAKDVASELDRRRRGRRRSLLLVVAAAIAAALTYLRCGDGWGLGGFGKGDGDGEADTTRPTEKMSETMSPGPRRCVVRVSAKGITVDGKQMKHDEAVAACKQTEGALVTVTGDARQGDWDDLRTALEAARVPIFTKNR